ncbi:hypothetical protein [Tolypothrix sp. VBCCA 56010]|uniref:hypothetical protein n=1 Tax=Tolypothrix sp. VBCCA 56010 TaxID=3137731 RepID=UPI003D7DD133
MAKFLGYYCGNFPNEDGLLQEMVEAWGGTFEKLNNAQRLWMLRALAENLFEKDPNSEADSEHDDEIEEVIERFDEIPDSSKLGLIEALVAQLKRIS